MPHAVFTATSSSGGVTSVTGTSPIASSGGATPAISLNSAGVTNTYLANMATLTIKGNNTGGSAAPLDLTAAQVKTLLAIANTDVSGLGTASTANTGTTSGTLALLTTGGVIPTSTHPALTGDVTTSSGSVTTTIAANAVTNAKAAQMPTLTLKGNNTGGTANATDLTVAQVNTMLGSSSSQWTTSGSDIYYTTGKVGIGTATPGGLLDIFSSTAGVDISARSTLSTGYSQLVCGNNDNTAATLHQLAYNTSATGTNFGISRAGLTLLYADGSATTALCLGTTGSKPLVLGTNNVERARITSTGDTCITAGNFGVGTTSPGSLVDVFSSTAGVDVSARSTLSTGYSQFVCGNNDNTAPTLHQFAFNASASGTSFGLSRAGMCTLYADGSATNYLIVGTTTAKPLMFGTNNLERVRIDSSGNVGIGNTSPGSKLDVTGTVTSTGIKMTTSPTSGYVLTCDSAGVGTWQAASAGVTSVSGTSPIASSGGATPAISLNTNGVTNSLLAQMAAYTLKGNNSGSTANASDLTQAQVRTILGFDIVAPYKYAAATTNQSGSTTSVAAESTYSIGAYLNITAITAGILLAQVQWTDENNVSQTLALVPMGLTSSNLTTTGPVGYPTIQIRVKASTSITVAFVFSGTSVTYDAGSTVQWLFS